jgi:outer membrane protein
MGKGNAYIKTDRAAGGSILFLLLLFFLEGVLPFSAGAEEPVQTLSLDDAKRLALERNLGLSVVRKEERMAEAEVKRRYADFFPKLSAEADYSRQGESPQLRIAPGTFSPAPLLPPAEIDLPLSDLTNYDFRLTLRQPLFAGGEIRYAYEGARLGRKLAGVSHQRTVQDLLLRVELAYWEILKTERLQEIAERQVSDLTEHLRVVNAFHDAGSVSYNEVLKTRVKLAEAEQRLLTARNDALLAKMVLNNQLRRELSTPFSIEPSEAKDEQTLPSREEALERGKAQRMEIAAQRTEVEILDVREELAKSGYYPRIDFIARYERAKETQTVLPENWELLGVLRWTFWEWRKTDHEVERARLEREKEEDRLRELRDRIDLEVEEAYLRAVEAREKIAVAERAVEQAEENYRIVREHFAAGETTNTEVLDAESLLVTARSGQANALYDFKSAKARLIRSMGATVLPPEAP